jgi:F420-dependent oxidoreductase-like protein
MKIGMTISRFGFAGGPEKMRERLAEMARTADEAGFDSLWVMDHFFQIGRLGPKTDPMLEAYTTLGYLAGQTKKVTLGALVGGVTYRDPGLLVKSVTTLDVLSGGRAYWGIGAGWNDEEAQALGLRSPIGNSRFERLEETLKIALQMWRGEQKPFKGEFYELGETISSPQPLSRPHPPIMIGGGGEQKTLRMVAQYADACNLFPGDVEHKLEVLRKHCEAVGRNYDEIEKSVMGGPIEGAARATDQIMRAAENWSGLGVSHIIFSSPLDPQPLEHFAQKVLPELHKL